MRVGPLTIALGVGLFALPPGGLTQVNTEKLRSWRCEGLGGSADLGVHLSQGNLELLQVASGLRLVYARFPPGATVARSSTIAGPPPIDLVYLVGDLAFGAQARETFQNMGFAHLRYTHMFSAAFGIEAFGQAQFNEFILIKERYLGGAGLRFEPVRAPALEVAVGSGWMLELEEYDVPRELEAEARAHRSTTYLTWALYAGDPVLQVGNTTYFQPRLDRPSDYRILNEMEASVSVGDRLALVVGFSLRYDSEPPSPDLEPLDLRVQNRLRMIFGR